MATATVGVGFFAARSALLRGAKMIDKTAAPQPNECKLVRACSETGQVWGPSMSNFLLGKNLCLLLSTKIGSLRRRERGCFKMKTRVSESTRSRAVARAHFRTRRRLHARIAHRFM